MSILDQAGLPLAAMVAVAALLAISTDRFALALGILLAGASISGITASVGATGIRIEQPGIVLLAAWLALRRPRACVAVLRRARWPIALGLVFLAANVGSGVLFAPDRLQSLKISLWLAISMLAAVVAAVLVTLQRPDEVHRQVVRWVVAAASLHAAAAIVQVGAELLLGSDWGVLRSDTPVGKAFGLAWEPNLLAIQLASALMFAVAPLGRRALPPNIRIGALVLISTGIALALSRGGIVAALGGVAILVVVIATRRPRLPGALRLVVRDGSFAAAIAVAGYVTLSSLAAGGLGLRPGEVAAAAEQPQGTLVPIVPGSGQATGQTAEPSGSSTGSTPPSSPLPSASNPAPSHGPDSRYLGAGDTIELRVRNFRIAVADGLTSPIIGLGPDTFGERYVEPTCACPAHLPNQLSATFYESGLVGLLSLVGLIGWVIVRAWRHHLDAYLAALAALLIGFQFTDALRFGATWLLIGTIVGLAVTTWTSSERSDPAPLDTR